LTALEIGADGITVLDADHRHFLAAFRDAGHVRGGERELDLAWRDLLGQPMDGVELGDGGTVGVLESGRRQVSLADVDDEERDVETALLHLRQVHLRRQPHRVVARGREGLGIDIVVRVERDDSIVNRPRSRCDVLLGERCRRHGNDGGDERCRKHETLLHGAQATVQFGERMRNL
jgi:hypothetical protein